MQTVNMATAVIVTILCAGSFVIASFQWKEKGPVFTNSYLLATPKERELLDIKAEYRLAAVVFTTLGIIFALLVLALLSGLQWLYVVATIGAVALVFYVIVKAVKSEEFR